MRTLLVLVAITLRLSASYAQEMEPASQLPMERGPAGTKPNPAANMADFAQKAYQANIYEISAAKIALQRAQQDGIRALARDILRDHEKAQTELVDAAQEQGQVLSKTLDIEQEKRLEALRAASKGEFDTVYLSDQIRAHQIAMQLLSAYAENGHPGPLKVYAQATFPTVRMHFVKAQAHSYPD